MKQPIHPIIDQFRKEFGEIVDKLYPQILKLLETMPAEKAVSKAFKDAGLDAVLAQSIAQKTVEAMAISIPVKKSYVSLMVVEVGQLSDKVYNLGLRQIVTEELNKAIKAGKTYQSFAVSLQEKRVVLKDALPQYIQDYLKRTRRHISDKEAQKELIAITKRLDRLAQNGAPNKALKASYLNLVEKSLTANKDQFKKAVRVALNEKARYNSERLARTEIAKAYGYAQDYEALNDPDVIGIKYSLSSRHRIYDICDFHTGADLYGMGKGVYPKKRHAPYPFHPNCTCVRSHIYTGDVKLGKYEKEAGDKFLKSIPKDKKALLLGVGGSQKYNDGKPWDRILRNWQGQETVNLTDLKKKLPI